MELIKQTYKGIDSTPIKTLNNLFNVIEGCFLYIFFDKEDILSFKKFNSNKNIFSYVCSDLENYISGDSTTYIENKNLNKFNVKN